LEIPCWQEAFGSGQEASRPVPLLKTGEGAWAQGRGHGRLSILAILLFPRTGGCDSTGGILSAGSDQTDGP